MAEGIETLRLDADRTRDELREVLDELEHRLSPKELAAAAGRAVREKPVVAGGIALGVLVVTGGLIAWRIIAARR